MDGVSPSVQRQSSFAAAASGVAMPEAEQLALALQQSEFAVVGAASHEHSQEAAAHDHDKESFLDAARAFDWETVRRMATERPELLGAQRTYTALHQAAMQSAEDEIMWMLQRGADVNAVSNNGAKDRPVDVAKKHGATDAAIALLEPGPTGNLGQRPLHVVSLSLFFHDEGDDVQQEATRLGVMQQVLPLAKVFLREEDALWATTPSSTDVHELYAALATTQQRLTSPVDAWHQSPGAANVIQVEKELRNELQHLLVESGVSVLRNEGSDAIRRFLTLAEPSPARLPDATSNRLTRAQACAVLRIEHACKDAHSEAVAYVATHRPS